MCEFQRVTNSKEELFLCEYTKRYCTLCVLGNAKTYLEAKEAQKEVRNNHEENYRI